MTSLETQSNNLNNSVEDWLNKFVVEIDDSIEAYNQQIGFQKITSVKDNCAAKYINMTLDQINKLNNEQLGEACWSLDQYALYVQKTINYERRWMIWAAAKIDFIIGKQIATLDNTTWWDKGGKQKYIIAHDKYAAKLEDFRLDKVMKIEELYGMVDGIRRISDSLNNIRYQRSRDK